MPKQRWLLWSALPLSFLLAIPFPASSQRPQQNTTSAPRNEKPSPKVPATGLTEEQLPAFAVSLVVSLATEARSYPDVALRSRVLARAADVLWDADNVNARALFKRAWDEAEKGDADQVTIKTKDNPPAMVRALRLMSGRDLRFEVLNAMAKRDRALSEEFFAKLKSENDSSKNNTAPPGDGWFVPEEVSKRLQVASALLQDGQTDKALQFAAPVLTDVNSHTIRFLSDLRKKNAEAADRVFARLLGRAEGDPASDANTVSGLSSYLFTPGLYVTFKPEGGTTWSQPDEPPVPPVGFPPALRERFFQVAANILIRPLPPSDIGARTIKLNVIKRLLPLFEQHAPDTATALRTQLQQMSNDPSRDPMGMSNPMLTEGITPPPKADDVLERMQDRIDRARTPRERDSIYASVVSELVAQGDQRARDIADKIEDPQRRAEIQQHVDFELVQRAIKRREGTEAVRLAETGRLSNTQRASAFIDVSRLFLIKDRQGAVALLEQAVGEVNRIEGDKPDRAILLLGIANQFLGADRVRAWEIMGEAIKEANRLEGFTGENLVTIPLMTRSGVKFLHIGGENYSLTNIFRSLAKVDFYRTLDVAKTLRYDAPRAAATLAIAGSILRPDK